MKVPVYKEDNTSVGFMSYIRDWLEARKIKPKCLLISKPNLIIAVLENELGRSLICFYIQRLFTLGTGGVIIYYDVNAMSTRLKKNVEHTFTNWIASAYIHD